MAPNIPFHSGELAVQERAGEAGVARRNGGALSHRIPDGAVPFLARQPMVVVASIGRDDSVWASVLMGSPGFLQADGGHSLHLDTTEPRSAADDPLWENLRANPHIGMLAIELASRRRLRVNGRVRSMAGQGLSIAVEAVYPNCPKYIQRRHWTMSALNTHEGSEPSRRGSALTLEQRIWIEQADTLFVASAHPEQGADASHRGGKPGFVQVLNTRLLRIPDYAGNSMFNTLGNFVSFPHVGLAFVDFRRGRVLQLSGRPVIRWDLSDPHGKTGGTGRFWDVEIEAWQQSRLALRLDWEFLDYSPFIPEASDAADDLVLQVVDIRQETDRIKRFRLRAFDDAELPAFTSGAHLPVTLALDSGERLLRRYSILSAPDERDYYDIGVLNEPRSRGGSRYLHERVRVGDQLATGKPRNEFPMTDSAEHSMLIAGGIGITPVLSMLRSLQSRGRSYELHYSAKHESDLAFRRDIEDLAGSRAHFYASRDADGRHVDLEALLGLPATGVHVYVCGPHRLINAVREAAWANRWPAGQIHFESFGTAQTAEDRAMSVTLARSGKVLAIPAQRSILDTLLDAGYALPHDCKRGECSLCTTRVLAGEPDHRDLCLTPVDRENSMCVCVSRARGESLVLDL
jgi:ferredoxin-NADP reductase/predicted pyridoxine 5'-phosphate oxidase superfamily flavin-nucleotide-binding protein